MITGIFFDEGGIFYTRAEPTRQYALRLVYEPDAKADYYAQSLSDLLNMPIFQR